MRRTPLSRFRIGVSAAVATASIGAALTFAATPAQAVPTIPGPGQSQMLVRDFVGNDRSDIIGQIYISPCPGAPLPPNWGVNTGVSYVTGLPCNPPIDPPQPTNPFPFPIST